MSTITHNFDDHIDGLTYCSQCGTHNGGAHKECNVVLVRRPSDDELSGLRQIQAGDVTSVRQALLADNWLDVLFRSCALQGRALP
jgi:hypothetical protein